MKKNLFALLSASLLTINIAQAAIAEKCPSVSSIANAGVDVMLIGQQWAGFNLRNAYDTHDIWSLISTFAADPDISEDQAKIIADQSLSALQLIYGPVPGEEPNSSVCLYAEGSNNPINLALAITPTIVNVQQMAAKLKQYKIS